MLKVKWIYINRYTLTQSTKKVCKFWAARNCVKGDCCPYMHSWFYGDDVTMLAKLQGQQKVCAFILTMMMMMICFLFCQFSCFMNFHLYSLSTTHTHIYFIDKTCHRMSTYMLFSQNTTYMYLCKIINFSTSYKININ